MDPEPTSDLGCGSNPKRLALPHLETSRNYTVKSWLIKSSVKDCQRTRWLRRTGVSARATVQAASSATVSTGSSERSRANKAAFLNVKAVKVIHSDIA